MAPELLTESCKKKRRNEFIPITFDCNANLKKAEEQIHQDFPDIVVFGHERVLFIEDKSKLLSMSILDSVKKFGGKLSSRF